ncbi:MAG TPA: hypothetical protein VEJ86_02285, partial [Candidatus Binataceae bacterium]|nr:hypothetical protein [Candidatus Binataceae bacterium]
MSLGILKHGLPSLKFAIPAAMTIVVAGLVALAEAQVAGGNVAAQIVLGQSVFTTSTAGAGPAGLNFPGGVVFDYEGCISPNGDIFRCFQPPSGLFLYVADSLNNRVLGWAQSDLANGAPADLVIGQNDFVSTAANQG